MKSCEYDLYKLIRSCYYKQLSNKDIAELANTSPRKVKSIITTMRLVEKRERYYRFLVNYAYSHGEQLDEISKRTGISVSSLRNIKRKYRIPTKRFKVPNKRMTEEIELEIIDLYVAGLSGQKVAEKFGFKTSKTVEDILKKYQVISRPPRMRRQLDYGFFRNIDSHDKAYILGLLYTDGYVYKDYDGFCIQLTESDGYLLEKIASRVGPAATVIHINCDCKRKTMPNVKDMRRMGVYSKILGEQVRELGVVKRKTWSLKIIENKLPKEFIYSFLRGVIDGDGTIGVYGNSVVCQFSTKSLWFAKGVCTLPIDEDIRLYHMSNGMFNVSFMGGKDKILQFLTKIYEHKNDLYLVRKYEKVQNQIM